jgi:hypothetical protein
MLNALAVVAQRAESAVLNHAGSRLGYPRDLRKRLAFPQSLAARPVTLVLNAD